MKFFLVGSLLYMLASSAEASPKVVARCSGFTLPNGLALSFEYVVDPKNTGISKPEIHSYERDSRLSDSMVKYLGPELCDSSRTDGLKIICVTELSETYTLDPKTKSGFETGDGYRAKYSCEFSQ